MKKRPDSPGFDDYSFHEVVDGALKHANHLAVSPLGNMAGYAAYVLDDGSVLMHFQPVKPIQDPLGGRDDDSGDMIEGQVGYMHTQQFPEIHPGALLRYISLEQEELQKQALALEETGRARKL